MTPGETISAAGREIYGPRWKTKLAKALGMSKRQIGRYANDQWPIPAVVMLAVQALQYQWRLTEDDRRKA